MSNSKQANPLLVVAMVVAIVGLVGFAITKALSPDVKPAPASATAAGDKLPAEPPPGKATEAPKKQVVNVNAAMTASPFRALPQMRAASGPSPAGVASSAPPQASSFRPAPALPPAPTGQSGPTPAPLLISRDRERRAAALQASVSREAGLPPVGGSVQPMPVTVEPLLLGTMLGSRPMAVFRSDKASVLVPQGGAYMGWRVMQVGHGEVTVWNGGSTVRLRVGAPSAQGMRTAGAPVIGPTDYATANCIVVHYGARTSPSRQELVYGRIEEPAYDRPRGLDSDVSDDQPKEEPDAPPVDMDTAKPDDQGLGKPGD